MNELSSGSPSASTESFAWLRPETENDRLVAALGYVFWILVPLIVLLTDLKRSRFAYVHALQGLVFGVASVVFVVFYTCVTIVLTAVVPPLGCILWIGYFVPLVVGLLLAYQAYAQGRTEFSTLSPLTRSLFRQQLSQLAR